MSDFPDDLLPLPYFPWDARPSGVPLDIEECRTALWLNRGNVTKASERLKISPGRLRTFVNSSPRLQRECLEAREQLVDLAEDIVHEALTDYVGESPGSARRDNMARYVMNSSIAEARGLGSKRAKINVDAHGPVIIGWASEEGFDNSAGKDAMGEEHGEGSVIEHDNAEPMRPDKEAAE
jgi:hypothetical protein